MYINKASYFEALLIYANGGKVPWEAAAYHFMNGAEPVSTMAGQAASRASIDTRLRFRQRSARKPKRVWAAKAV